MAPEKGGGSIIGYLPQKITIRPRGDTEREITKRPVKLRFWIPCYNYNANYSAGYSVY